MFRQVIRLIRFTGILGCAVETACFTRAVVRHRSHHYVPALGVADCESVEHSASSTSDAPWGYELDSVSSESQQPVDRQRISSGGDTPTSEEIERAIAQILLQRQLDVVNQLNRELRETNDNLKDRLSTALGECLVLRSKNEQLQSQVHDSNVQILHAENIKSKLEQEFNHDRDKLELDNLTLQNQFKALSDELEKIKTELQKNKTKLQQNTSSSPKWKCSIFTKTDRNKKRSSSRLRLNKLCVQCFSGQDGYI